MAKWEPALIVSGSLGNAAVVATRPSSLLLLVALGFVSFACVSDDAKIPIACKFHAGAFTNDFTTDFDISSLGCHVEGLEQSPTLRFWAVPPYVGVEKH